jgi:CheY-like chemotaxis protein
MTEATLERLFEPFFTMRSTGNGLGLATIHEIIRQHGGAMNVRSSLGRGSHFEAWLPCLGPNMPLPGAAIAARPLACGETLLLVGEDKERLLGEEEILAALGYEPRSFGRFEDALAAYRAEPKRFEGLILSHVAPLAEAIHLARRFHQAMHDVPILLTVPSMQDIDARLLISAGISEVIRHPINSAEIAAALRRALKETKASNRETRYGAPLSYAPSMHPLGG